MLIKLSPHFEKHHQLKIDPEAIKESVRLSKRYLRDRQVA
jgi:ATP-dependent Clp protease ATP-binding subunit ClpA